MASLLFPFLVVARQLEQPCNKPNGIIKNSKADKGCNNKKVESSLYRVV